MNVSDIQGIHLTESQNLLLATLVAPEADVRLLYEKWASVTPFDSLDGGSYRLMPMLYKKIASLNLLDDRCEKIKGIYRYTLYKNSMILSAFQKITQSLQDAGVRVMMLKGSVLILKYYPDKAVRPMNDIDLLIDKSNLDKALEILGGLGWQDTREKVYDLSLRRHPATTLISRQGFELDLHWNIMSEYNPGLDASVWWLDARVIDYHGISVHLLSAEDQVLHLCAHGMKWDTLPSIRWIPDVLTVLETETGLRWEMLVQKCRNYKVTVSVRCALNYLKKEFNAPIPDHVLDLLFAQPVSDEEQTLYNVYTSPLTFSQRVVRQWGLCQKDYTKKSWLVRICLFPGYLKKKSGIVRYSDCAIYLFTQLIRVMLSPLERRDGEAKPL